jgi:hypothetical protein
MSDHLPLGIEGRRKRVEAIPLLLSGSIRVYEIGELRRRAARIEGRCVYEGVYSVEGSATQGVLRPHGAA